MIPYGLSLTIPQTYESMLSIVFKAIQKVVLQKSLDY
jgi:hypothetical protein